MKNKPANKPEPARGTKQSAQGNKPALSSTNQKPVAVTQLEYSSLQRAYDFFNEKLFHAKLPQPPLPASPAEKKPARRCRITSWTAARTRAHTASLKPPVSFSTGNPWPTPKAASRPSPKPNTLAPQCDFNAWAIPSGRREHDLVEMTCISFRYKTIRRGVIHHADSHGSRQLGRTRSMDLVVGRIRGGQERSAEDSLFGADPAQGLDDQSARLVEFFALRGGVAALALGVFRPGLRVQPG